MATDPSSDDAGVVRRERQWRASQRSTSAAPAVGHLADARREHERARVIWEKAFGPDHSNVAIAQTNLAHVDEDEGKLAEAERGYGSALAMLEKSLGPEHPRAGSVHGNLSTLFAAQGRYGEAERERLSALAIWEKVLDPANHEVPSSLVLLARLRIDDGRATAAISDAERALELFGQRSAGPFAIAEAKFVLGRARWDAGDDRRSARALVEEAQAIYATAAAEHRKVATEIEQWLATHPRD